MKKITYIITIISLAVGITSCSKDDLVGTGSYTSSVSVIKQDVCFDAPASEGSIEFSAPSTATVSTTADWCKATLNGSIIKVSATQNNDRNSRSCNVIIRCGADSAKVNVIQNGYIFQLSAGNAITTSSDEAKTLSYDYSSNLDFRFSTNEAWFTPSCTDGKLSISITENTTGHIRKGYLYYTAGDLTDSLAITQYDYAKDIAGAGFLCYKDATGQLFSTEIEITDSCIVLTELAKYGDIRIPFTFNEKTMTFSFANAQDCGKYSNYYVSACMFNGQVSTYYKSVSWDAKIQVNPIGYMEAYMTDNGSWQYAFEGFDLDAFKTSTISGPTRVGIIMSFYSPYIMRFDQTSSAKTKTYLPTTK